MIHHSLFSTEAPHILRATLYTASFDQEPKHPQSYVIQDKPQNLNWQKLSGKKSGEKKIYTDKSFVASVEGSSFVIDHSDHEAIQGSLHQDKDHDILTIDLLSQDRVFGLGAMPGPLKRNNQFFHLMNLDTLFGAQTHTSYSSFPFFLIARENSFVGIFYHTPLALDITVDTKMKHFSRPTIHIHRKMNQQQQPADLFVFHGNLSEILAKQAQLTGKPFMPPIWSLGFHQSRWSYKSQDKVLDIAQKFRHHDLPLDAIHLDIHYMDRYKVFTWDPKKFPQPSKMNDELSQKGVRTVAIVDPGVYVEKGYPVYDEGHAENYFCRTSYDNIFWGKVWPGTTAFPDFNMDKVREWWARRHDKLLQNGVSGIWNDMNDPVLHMGKKYAPLQEDIYHHGIHHSQVRNLYANQEAEAAQRAFELYQPQKRPFILTRSAFSGIQKFAALWTGDNHSSWSQLRENLYMILNLGLSGVPFSGADVGGFGSRRGMLGAVKILRHKELFARWMQLGSLMPFFRAHTTLYSTCQEPWCFGKQVLQISRKHIQRRYLLLPYIYLQFRHAAQTGEPPVRPLFYRNPKLLHQSSEYWQSQFFVGDSLLAAPIMHRHQRKRKVFLPEGEWYEFEHGTLFSGDEIHSLNTPLDYYPLFAKAGAIVPTGPLGPNSEAMHNGPINLEVYPGSELYGQLYLDDGVSLEAEQKEHYFLLEAKGKSKNGQLEIQLKILKKKYIPSIQSLRIRVPHPYKKLSFRGKEVSGKLVDLTDEGRLRKMSQFEIPVSEGKLTISQ